MHLLDDTTEDWIEVTVEEIMDRFERAGTPIKGGVLIAEAMRDAYMRGRAAEIMDELEKRRWALDNELHDINSRIWNEQERLAMEKYPVKVGDMVRDVDGDIFRVVEVTYAGGDKPCIAANPMNKDGSFSKRIRSLCRSWFPA